MTSSSSGQTPNASTPEISTKNTAQNIPQNIKGPEQVFTGFLLALAGLLFFACMDATTKFLTADYQVPFVVAMRYLVHFSLMVVVLAPRYSIGLVQTQRRGLVVLRACTLVMASLFVGLALKRMPLAETTAISFLAPMLVVLLAKPLLGEKIGLLGWLAAVGGFMGVLLIARPGGGLDVWGILFALLAVLANAAYQILSRVLASTERAVTLLFYTALAGSIVFGLALPWFWDNKAPSHLDLALFLGMGACGGLGHYLFTLAYQYTPASLLAPVLYIQLIWAALLGWIIFDSTPDHVSIFGMIIVAASGLLIALKSRMSKC